MLQYGFKNWGGFICSSDDDSIDDDSINDCTQVECLNGGTETVDCECDCLEGYGGNDCGTQLTPSSITILEVDVKKFPMSDEDGNVWDQVAVGSSTNPDLQLDILDASEEPIYQSEALDDRVSSGNCDDTNSFLPSVQLSGDDITSELSLVLYDEDTTEWEFIGGWTINELYSSNDGFPIEISVGECSDDIVFELVLDYSW